MFVAITLKLFNMPVYGVLQCCLQVLRLHAVSHARRRRYRGTLPPGEEGDPVPNVFQVNSASSARGMSGMSALLEGRLRQLIRTLPEQDERARLLRNFLRRAPRERDGTIELGAMLHILQALEGGRGLMTSSRRTPQETLDLLPTFAFEPREVPPLPPGETDEDEIHRHKCMVCLTEYESGEMIRTLPCLHQFHRGVCLPRRALHPLFLWLPMSSSTSPCEGGKACVVLPM